MINKELIELQKGCLATCVVIQNEDCKELDSKIIVNADSNDSELLTIFKEKISNKEELDYFVGNYFNKESINIPIKQEAVIYITKLKELGYEIVFITNRGIKDDDHTDLIVPEYLEKNNIPYYSIITKSKDKYMYLNDCEYFIDDAIRNCEQAIEKSNAKVIMMETNKTKDYNNDKIFKASNWQEVYDYITK